MRIKYPTRSEFIATLRHRIKLERARLESGHPIEIALKPGGYAGKWAVVVRADDDREFEVLGSMKDPSRFAQRIRVTAWALREEGLFGQFAIDHDRESGTVAIKRL
jgi:hypothetical protein